ncbi:MAG: hypothetical protein MZV49_18530 [Rhodopseudomonas palustris]|nr:hypothetical protein [Rhodopseudomonas palustris]
MDTLKPRDAQDVEQAVAAAIAAEHAAGDRWARPQARASASPIQAASTARPVGAQCRRSATSPSELMHHRAGRGAPLDDVLSLIDSAQSAIGVRAD